MAESPLNFKDLQGKLINKDGKCELNPADLDFVGLYFSAHWCPPCRAFTPKLAEYYKEYKGKNRKFEIIFLSSDRDEGSYKEYFSEMPWIAPAFNEGETKQTLSSKYGVTGIPTLVILKPDGSLKTKDGRGMVMSGKYCGDD